jgi:hypothetical protein
MGNRAVIAFTNNGIKSDNAPAIYLHWNGGRDSVEAFLEVAKQLNVRGNDPQYGCARLTQIIGNYFGGTLSLGVGCYDTMEKDNYDNGVYWVHNWEIVDRKYNRNSEQYEHDHDEMVKEVLEKNKAAFEVAPIDFEVVA